MLLLIFTFLLTMENLQTFLCNNSSNFTFECFTCLAHSWLYWRTFDEFDVCLYKFYSYLPISGFTDKQENNFYLVGGTIFTLRISLFSIWCCWIDVDIC